MHTNDTATIRPLHVVFMIDPYSELEVFDDLDLIHEGRTLEEFIRDDMPDCPLVPAIVISTERVSELDDSNFLTVQYRGDTYDTHDSLVIPLSFSDLGEFLWS